MVFQIECSDEQGEHVELNADGTVRLFGRDRFSEEHGAFTVTERQLGLLMAMLKARADLHAAVKR